MARRNEDKSISEVVMVLSREMLQKCKKEISFFGFNPVEYTKFLVTVGAMTESGYVLQYHNSDIEKYVEKFTKKFESLGDIGYMNKFKIKTSDTEGKVYETGYFCPRSFWDYVSRTY